MSTGEPRIALVHDELIRRGGAEAVFEELTRMFPKADVYALYAGTTKLDFDPSHRKLFTSFIQRFPIWMRRHPSRVLPFLPLAAEKFDFSKYDLVISSASGFSKAIITRAGIPHLCYCHTPTRYVWDSSTPRLRRAGPLARVLLHYLRLVDYAAAQRVDTFLANSAYTQQRIEKYYRRPSRVVYPPIRNDFFVPGTGKRGDYFLVVGRLTGSKHFEQAISVCEKLRLPLKVVGVGHIEARLRHQARLHTTFVGRVSDDELKRYYQEARALLLPGVEDFGMTAAEALASGTPVIAQDAGGVREIVTSETGMLYEGDTVEALAEGVRQFLLREHSFSPLRLADSVWKFSGQNFRDGVQNAVAKVLGAGNY